MTKLAIFIICTITAVSAFSQQTDTLLLNENEAVLRDYFKSLYSTEDFNARDSINNKIIRVFEESLKTNGSFKYLWSGLDMIGKIKSDDDRIKIFTWYLEKNPDEYLYYGFVQVSGTRKNEMKVIFLNDRTSVLKNSETLELTAGNWHGALYYGMRTYKYKKKAYYAIFGYVHNNPYSHKKLIEVLRLNSYSEPLFGGEFRIELQKLKRVIFEYSSEIVMSLRYNERLKKIVFDHLSPVEPVFANNRRYFVPDGTFDAFTFSKGLFIMEKDVDARND